MRLLYHDDLATNVVDPPDPAVTVGLIVTGNLPVMRGLILMPTQIISAMCASAVAGGIIPGDIAVVQTTIAPDVSVAQGLFIEMVSSSPTRKFIRY